MTKIFLVEDEPGMIEDLRLKISKIGCEIIGIASSAADAMNRPEIRSSDLILLDLKLNTSVKGKTANKILQQHSRKPVVFVSRENRFDENTLKGVIEKVLKLYAP